MYGYWYSVKKNFEYSNTELKQMFWTAVAFAFILTFRKWGVGKSPEILVGTGNLLLALFFVSLALYAHVSMQKLIAIKLGYKATYSYWLNGILISLLLCFISLGYIMFILPGAVMLEHVPHLRLGKFRYGVNLKDIARVALAGPLAHLLLVMILGLLFMTARSELIYSFIVINLLLAVYSLLPIPKIDSPQKMDSGTDGLGILYFNRTLYVLVFITMLLFSAMMFTAATYEGMGWMFFISLVVGIIFTIMYFISVEQKN